MKGGRSHSGRCARLMLGAVLLLFFLTGPQLYAVDKAKDEYDAYKLRFEAFWFDAHPTGSFTGAGNNGSFDFQRDFALGSYSTFSGKLDWRITKKNHLYFAATPFDRSRNVVLNRTVTFQGQTVNAGLNATGELSVLALVPGYERDFIRRKRGHLGVLVQLDLFDVDGTLNAMAQTLNGAQQAAKRSEGSLRAPIPVAGPDVRLYLLPHSGRLFVTGNVLGMYLFGYGNFISTLDTVGVTLTKHLSIRAGYQLASRLNVNTKTTRVGLSLTQKGAIVGLEVSF